MEPTHHTDKSYINSPDIDGNTPLHHAANHGSISNIKILAAAAPDVNAKNNLGQTPLDIARLI